jgi:hypothetical protein
MTTISEIESKIRSIAGKSSKFKIGKTGLAPNKRLSLHKDFKRIETISWSRKKTKIDSLETKMNDKFHNWQNNVNRNRGSAGEMSDDAEKYVLYVVYTLKKRQTTKKTK